MVATDPVKPGKCPFFKEVSENLEKSGKSVEKACMSGKNQGIIFD